MRTKYKLNQMIQSNNASGVIDELHIKRARNDDGAPTGETFVTYVLEDKSEVEENEVTAVFRPVTPRKAASAPRAKKKKAAEAKAA